MFIMLRAFVLLHCLPDPTLLMNVLFPTCSISKEAPHLPTWELTNQQQRLQHERFNEFWEH